jgi:hypothetical protein
MTRALLVLAIACSKSEQPARAPQSECEHALSHAVEVVQK